jgi:hypothetical protein
MLVYKRGPPVKGYAQAAQRPGWIEYVRIQGNRSREAWHIHSDSSLSHKPVVDRKNGAFVKLNVMTRNEEGSQQKARRVSSTVAHMIKAPSRDKDTCPLIPRGFIFLFTRPHRASSHASSTGEVTSHWQTSNLAILPSRSEGIKLGHR